MDRDMNILYILGVPLGYVMEWIYNLIPNYGWDIIIFTIVIRLISIPLQLNQQKSMAKMSAFQPMIADIQKKYKDKPEKQQEELLKLQQEYGYKPTAGCMPMLVNFLVMFGVIEVVYRPLQRIFHIGADAITAAFQEYMGRKLRWPRQPIRAAHSTTRARHTGHRRVSARPIRRSRTDRSMGWTSVLVWVVCCSIVRLTASYGRSAARSRICRISCHSRIHSRRTRRPDGPYR